MRAAPVRSRLDAAGAVSTRERYALGPVSGSGDDTSTTGGTAALTSPSGQTPTRPPCFLKR